MGYKYKSKEELKNLELYKEFNWQRVKKLADEIGVRFYSDSSYRRSNGLGFKIDRWDKTKINVEGYVQTYGENNYDRSTLIQVSKELFWTKIELYFLKNNIQYVVSDDKQTIQILK